MYYENKKEKQRKNLMAIIFMVIIIALLTSLNLKLQLLNEKNIQENYSAEKLESFDVFDEQKEKDTKNDYEFIEEASKAIVGISKLKTVDNSFLEAKTQTVGNGSGIVITDTGYVITNQHLAR